MPRARKRLIAQQPVLANWLFYTARRVLAAGRIAPRMVKKILPPIVDFHAAPTSK